MLRFLAGEAERPDPRAVLVREALAERNATSDFNAFFCAAVGGGLRRELLGRR